MKILVTGATGFIGSRITHQLLALGHDVRILRRATSKLDMLDDDASKVEHAVGSINDPEDVDEAISGTEVVFHAAATVHMGSRHVRKTNVNGTAHIVNAALDLGVKRLVHTSSIAALGRPTDAEGPVDESTEWEPSNLHTPYAVSKREAELQVYRGIAEGLDAVLVNPSLVFGPHPRFKGTTMIAHYLNEGSIKVYPKGAVNVVDVDDVAAGHILAWQKGKTGERYILGSENLSWKQLLDTLANALGVAPPRRQIPQGLAVALGALVEIFSALTRRLPMYTRAIARSNASQWVVSNEKAIRELGCTFRPFEETAQRIAATFSDRNVR